MSRMLSEKIWYLTGRAIPIPDGRVGDENFVFLMLLILLAGGGVFGLAVLSPGLLPPEVLTMLGRDVPLPEEKSKNVALKRFW